ncbi:MAG: hypothetical protein L0216_04225 [Planctomycetales bacterium]|nr:hypothetical protein [Planctomycetales bacterium]
MRTTNGWVPFLALVVLCGTVPAQDKPSSSDPAAAPGRVVVPFGKEPTLDGALGEGEWTEAARVKLGEGSEVLFKHGEKQLFVALSSSAFAWGSLLVRSADAVSVLHASAALGEVRFERQPQAGKWKRKDRFDFRAFHERVGRLTRAGKPEEEALPEVLRDYEKENGWCASCLRKPPASDAVVEFRIAFAKLGLDPKKIASDDPKTFPEIRLMAIQSRRWPESVREDKRFLSLLHMGGEIPDEVEFLPESWGTLASKTGWRKPKTG